MKPSDETVFPGRVVIGLTGTIASGKSTVMAYLAAQYGCMGIDADLVARGAVEDSKEQLASLFGNDVIRGGHVDRTRLGQIVFSDPEKLQMLNHLVHPETAKRIWDMILDTDAKLIAVEAIELLRSDVKDLVDEVWVVYAPVDVRIERMMLSRGMDEASAVSRIRSQWDDDTYRRMADVVIPSGRDGLQKMLDHVDEEVSALYERYPAVLEKEGKDVKEEHHA